MCGARGAGLVITMFKIHWITCRLSLESLHLFNVSMVIENKTNAKLLEIIHSDCWLLFGESREQSLMRLCVCVFDDEDSHSARVDIIRIS